MTTIHGRQIQLTKMGIRKTKKRKKLAWLQLLFKNFYETSAIINQTPGNYPKESLLYSVHGESLKSRKYMVFSINFYFCLGILHIEKEVFYLIMFSVTEIMWRRWMGEWYM